MKRYIVLLMTVAVVAALLLGCVPGAPQAPTAPTEPAGPERPTGWESIPTEPAGFPQPNPYWGLGFKPDGTPYEFSVVICGLLDEAWTSWYYVVITQLQMSGANVSPKSADANLGQQVAIMEDLIEKGTDGIVLMTCDEPGITPVASQVAEAGIPLIAIDTPNGGYETVFCGCDNYYNGVVGGEVMVEIAERMNTQLNVLELWCPMGFPFCTLGSQGFNDIVAESPLVTVVQQAACEAVDEQAMNTIMDAFPAKPDLNAIYTVGGMNYGTIQALKAIDRYVPIGDPKHIVWCGECGLPSGLEAVRDKIMDGGFAYDWWAAGDAAPKALMTLVCLGESVPEFINVGSEELTLENIDEAPYGEPMRGGDMVFYEEDRTLWPILDLSEIGLPTPTYAMLLEKFQ